MLWARGVRLIATAGFALALLCSVAAQEEPQYSVRLFWRSAAIAIEVAPAEGPGAHSALHAALGDGRVIGLRGTLAIRAEGDLLRIGGRWSNHSPRFEAKGPLRLRAPDGPWSLLPGTLRVWAEDNSLHAEVELSREDYVAAVLAGEGGGIREAEALKALAVAIRSYAFALPDRHRDEGFHFCDTTHCQDLRLTARNPAIDAAVRDTAGVLLWRDGDPVPAWHHADSGGKTEDARVVWGDKAPAWLRGKPDPYSAKPERFAWVTDIEKADLFRALRAEGYTVAKDNTKPPEVAVTRTSGSGRAMVLMIGGHSFSAPTVRFAVGRHLGWNRIRSDLYEVEDLGQRVRFRGAGAGHGVGLSQIGAQRMAREGSSFKDILAFYFPGTRVGVAASGVPWQLISTARVRAWFVSGNADPGFAALVEKQLGMLEAETSWRLRQPLNVRVYPSVSMYRDATGNAGWMAAATRGAEIAFQPLEVLRRQQDLPGLVRHEVAHVLISAEARKQIPTWLQEGLAATLAGGSAQGMQRQRGERGFSTIDELENAFSSADRHTREIAAQTAWGVVMAAVRRFGRPAVLSWSVEGPPEDNQVLSRLLEEAGQR